MLEIGVAISVATSSFKFLKSAFAAGRDLESMSQDVGRWLTAVADIDRREKENKRPVFYQRLFMANKIQAEAIEIFAAKKKLEKQRQELRNFVIAHHGLAGWDQLIRLEGKIRKERAQAIYQQREARQQLFEWAAVLGFLTIGVILLIYFVWIANEAKAY
jgi:hypothetical protein